MSDTELQQRQQTEQLGANTSEQQNESKIDKEIETKILLGENGRANRK